MRNVILIVSIVCLAGCADKGEEESADKPGFVAGPARPIDKGELLYAEKCSACHGADGTAGIAGAANLKTSRKDSMEVSLQITNGKNAMPGFKAQLSTEEIGEIAHYVFRLRR